MPRLSHPPSYPQGIRLGVYPAHPGQHRPIDRVQLRLSDHVVRLLKEQFGERASLVVGSDDKGRYVSFVLGDDFKVATEITWSLNEHASKAFLGRIGGCTLTDLRPTPNDPLIFEVPEYLSKPKQVIRKLTTNHPKSSPPSSVATEEKSTPQHDPWNISFSSWPPDDARIHSSMKTVVEKAAWEMHAAQKEKEHLVAMTERARTAAQEVQEAALPERTMPSWTTHVEALLQFPDGTVVDLQLSMKEALDLLRGTKEVK